MLQNAAKCKIQLLLFLRDYGKTNRGGGGRQNSPSPFPPGLARVKNNKWELFCLKHIAPKYKTAENKIFCKKYCPKFVQNLSKINSAFDSEQVSLNFLFIF